MTRLDICKQTNRVTPSPAHFKTPRINTMNDNVLQASQTACKWSDKIVV